MMVLDRERHAPVLARAEALDNSVGLNFVLHDQTPLNAAIADVGTPMLALDAGWNWMSPNSFGHWDGMERFVYHFACDGDRWTIPPHLSNRAAPAPWTEPGTTFIPAKRLRLPRTSALDGEATIWKKAAGSGDALISYGPYCTMSPGRKRVEVRTDLIPSVFFRTSKPLLRIELTHSHGQGRIAETVIHRREPVGIYVLDFTLKSRTSWFEVVLRAEAGPARRRFEGLTLFHDPRSQPPPMTKSRALVVVICLGTGLSTTLRDRSCCEVCVLGDARPRFGQNGAA